MNKIHMSLLTTLVLTSLASLAQSNSSVPATQDVVPVLKGINLVEGKDKKLHLIIDGQRIGAVQVDHEWATKTAGLTVIPSQYWEPAVKKPLKLKDPCIYASSGGKCIPDFAKQGPLIKLANDIWEIGVLTRK